VLSLCNSNHIYLRRSLFLIPKAKIPGLRKNSTYILLYHFFFESRGADAIRVDTMCDFANQGVRGDRIGLLAVDTMCDFANQGVRGDRIGLLAVDTMCDLANQGSSRLTILLMHM